MSILDRIQGSFKYLDKNGLKHLIEKIKLHDVHWTGTHAEYEAQKDTIPNYAILHFTDDYSDTVEISSYKETIWTGNVTKGGNIGKVLNLADYDIVIGVLGNRYAYLQNIPANEVKNKFVAHWTGRDNAAQAGLYWQEYVCDIAADGTVLTCAWVRLAENSIVEANLSETNIALTKIFGIKFPEKV